MRVLIVKRDKIGDLLLTTPVFAHLKAARSDVGIHLLANDYNAWVAKDDPALTKTWVYPRSRDSGRLRPAAVLSQLGLAWKLRRAKFDWAIAMGGEESPRAIHRAIATGSARIVAYARDPARYGRGLTDPLPPPSRGHEIARMLALLAPLDIAAPTRLPIPEYRWPTSGDAFAQRWLAERGMARGGYIVLGIGARFSQKQPTLEQILRWSAAFHDRWGLPTVFLWTPGKIDAPFYRGDDEIAGRLIARCPPYVHPYRGELTEVLALIGNARASVIPDSGLMHFAAASRGGVVGLFADSEGIGSAERWRPVGPRARVIQARRTVAELADEAVIAALDPLVAGAPAFA